VLKNVPKELMVTTTKTLVKNVMIPVQLVMAEAPMTAKAVPEIDSYTKVYVLLNAQMECTKMKLPTPVKLAIALAEHVLVHKLINA